MEPYDPQDRQVAPASLGSGFVPGGSAEGNESERVTKRLEAVGKAAAALGAISYLLGMIAMNVHLNSYGVDLLGFFAQEYVAAGIWVMLTLGVGAALGGLGFAAIRSLQRPTLTRRRRVFTASAYLLMTTALCLLTYESLTLLGVRLSGHWILPTVAGTFAALAAAGRLFPYSRLERRYDEVLKEIQLGPLLPDVPTLARAGAVLLFVLFGVVVFGADVYDRIPARWGGGNPVVARIWADKAHSYALRSLYGGCLRAPDSLPAQPIMTRILLMTDETVALAVNRHCRSSEDSAFVRSVVVKRDLVQAIEFLRVRLAREPRPRAARN